MKAYFGYILEEQENKSVFILNFLVENFRIEINETTIEKKAYFFEFENFSMANGFCKALNLITRTNYKPKFVMRRFKPIKH